MGKVRDQNDKHLSKALQISDTKPVLCAGTLKQENNASLPYLAISYILVWISRPNDFCFIIYYHFSCVAFV